MPDTRSHRGPNPKDKQLFCSEMVSKLQQAVGDLSLLLTKGYSLNSSLKLVGDRYALTERQRMAVRRSSCSDFQVQARSESNCDAKDLNGKAVLIDGYNTLITIEAVLSGGVLFKGRDGCFRDLASIHGTYRKVTETIPALELIATFLAKLSVQEVLWYFDKPISNSGRLKTIIIEFAAEKNYPWKIELVNNPDQVLIDSKLPVISSDSNVLDNCTRWFNLTETIINQQSDTWIIDLSSC